MVRTKSVPSKRCITSVGTCINNQVDDDDGDQQQQVQEEVAMRTSRRDRSFAAESSSSFLSGRIVHPDWNVLATEELLAGERGEWFSRRHVVITTSTPAAATAATNNNNNNDDNSNSHNNKYNKHKSGKEDHVLVQSSSEEEEDDVNDNSNMSGRKRLRRLRRQQRLPSGRKRRNQHSKKKKSKTTTTTSSRVRFASTTDFIELPEIMIEEHGDAVEMNDDGSVDGDNELHVVTFDVDDDYEKDWKATIWYQPATAIATSTAPAPAPSAVIVPPCQNQNELLPECSSSVFVLQRFELQRTRLCQAVVTHNDDEDDVDSPSNHEQDNAEAVVFRNQTTTFAPFGGLIRSNLGIRYLLQYCHQRCCSQPTQQEHPTNQLDSSSSSSSSSSSNNHNNRNQSYYDSVVDAIGHGILQLSVEPVHHPCSCIVRVSLSLTPQAMNLCCPAFCRRPTNHLRPLASSNATSNNSARNLHSNNNKHLRFGKKLVRPEVVLQNLLAVLLPNTVVAQGKPQVSSMITAKDVYELVDNVRLNQYYEKHGPQQQQLQIPALVPTLRPYQQAAVEWMIQREQVMPQGEEEENDGNEWELAWVVFTASTCNMDIDRETDANMTVHVEVYPLPEWKKLTKMAPHQSTMYCSPFWGWLAHSWQEAKDMSLKHCTNSDDNEEQGTTTARGGILADSMGLGKTVEVLACMLAHPRPLPAAAEEEEEELPILVDHLQQDNPTTSGPSQFLLSDDTEPPNTADTRHKVPPDFCDATAFTDDRSSDSEKIVNQSEKGQDSIERDAASIANAAGVAEMVTPSTSTTEILQQQLPPVTPDITKQVDTLDTKGIATKQERLEWVPSYFEFGSCVCGRVIPFQTKEPIVVICGSCREPMHVKCTAFASMDQISRETTKVIYKRRFVHDTKVGRICQERQCPSCVAQAISAGRRKPFKSRATLIVTPTSILNQWEREIQRHASTVGPSVKENSINREGLSGAVTEKSGESSEDDKLRPIKVAIYSGVRELCHRGGKLKAKSKHSVANNLSPDSGIGLLHPAKLADHDVVLLTFDALMSDLGHSDENPYAMSSSETLSTSGKLLRGKKRYRVAPSPLSAIDWWRVCLDEAQRVETTTAACARMALKLLAQHRWCVSGTPIGKGKLDDLYGLLLFLRLQPFSDKSWFDKCLALSHRGVGERIQHLLSSCFWRSTKASELVRIQMGVPEQIEKKVILRFSSIEKHFYDRQLEETLAIATDVAEPGMKRKASQLDQLSQHVHKLRAACCHPQVGSSGIGRLKKRRKVAMGQQVKGDSTSDVGAGSMVLTMDQILDRLIDDAKLKCEEAQRRTLMHTNAMASLAKLKVEAKQFGCNVKEDDASLFLQSCKLYQESLDLTEENGKPSTVVGEAVLSGSQGFRSSQKIIRDGRATFDWQIKDIADEVEGIDRIRQVWSRIDFEGPSKRVIEIRVRPLWRVPEDLIGGEGNHWDVLSPKNCLFQVASSAVGGEFIDVCQFTMPEGDTSGETGWTITGGFRTNKSKSWRIVVLDYHDKEICSKMHKTLLRAFYVGMEVELCEADIANDPLQRLHIMHNAIISSECLLQLSQCEDGLAEKTASWLSLTDIKQRTDRMQEECRKIESLYMDSARALHHECQRRLRVATDAREEQESSLLTLSRSVRKRSSDLADCWSDEWWSDLLVACTLQGSEHDQKSLCDLVRAELDSFLHGGFHGVFVGISTNRLKKTFPDFNDSNGILTGLNLRMEDHRNQIPPGGHARCMLEIGHLSANPTEAEMLENSHCRECKADWNQKGAACRFCKMGKRLSDLEPDRLLLTVLKSLWIWIRGSKKSSSLLSARAAARIDERAKKFFDVLEANKKEISAAHRAWRTHLDLMNDLDELNMCKRTMRLAQDGEDLTQYTEDELRSIVMPIDVVSKYLDHAAKQAMDHANLRRQKHTLRYLKNQNKERLEEHGANSTEDQSCVVCLCPLEGDRAVLLCGHSFHSSPCLERLMKRPGNHQVISCPLRCNVRTKREEVMIASDKRSDDGSRSKRAIKGSWGTKVTRLVADVMDAADLAEKSIVFSMWEDMLEVVEQALTMNSVGFVRVKSSSRIGESTRRFRALDCSVLLLNVKNGAEGLTLVEATHVFMIEPLLNCGLDSQAINRIHRIGQTCKTYVHRYLIQDTIEMKIDKMRMERQADQLQLEDAIHEAKKKHDISGGGIDGGFTEAELQDLLH